MGGKWHKDEFERDFTQYEVARIMNLSQGRVMQLEKIAIAKLRSAILADPVLRTMAEEVCGTNLLDSEKQNARISER